VEQPQQNGRRYSMGRKKPIRDVYTVMYPEGLRLTVHPGWSSDTVPRGANLEYVGATSLVPPNKKKHEAYVVLKHLESGRQFKMPLKEAERMKELEGIKL
jgi:hypothetical protein